MSYAVRMPAFMGMSVLMGMGLRGHMGVFVTMIVDMVSVRTFVAIIAMFTVLMFRLRVGMRGMPVILIMRMHRSGMNAEFDALNALPFLSLEVHVKVADIELGELPFQGRRLDSQVTERADGHVAADTRRTIKKEETHETVYGG